MAAFTRALIRESRRDNMEGLQAIKRTEEVVRRTREKIRRSDDAIQVFTDLLIGHASMDQGSGSDEQSGI